VGGRKSPSPIDKAHGLYNSLYYRTSRDMQLRKNNNLPYHFNTNVLFFQQVTPFHV